MRVLIVLFSILLLVVGCSLVDDGEITSISGPRLLLTNGQPAGFLSHPKANDWAPQMASLVQVGGAVTNRYLYFLSDRDTPPGSPVKVYSVYRARHKQGLYFENLELIHTNTNQIASIIVANRNSYGDPDRPDIYLTIRNSLSGFLRMQKLWDIGGSWALSTEDAAVTTLFMSGDVITAGHIINSTNKQYLFLMGSVSGYKVLTPFHFAVTGAFEPVNAALVYPLALTLNKFKLGGRTFLGAWPIVMRLPEGGNAFGFVISYGGGFYLAFNRNATSFADWAAKAPNVLTYATSPFFQGEKVAALYSVEHIAGSVDRDPSFDPESGFYFSSNRDGNFDLYFVPKSFFLFSDKVE